VECLRCVDRAHLGCCHAHGDCCRSRAFIVPEHGIVHEWYETMSVSSPHALALCVALTSVYFMRLARTSKAILATQVCARNTQDIIIAPPQSSGPFSLLTGCNSVPLKHILPDPPSSSRLPPSPFSLCPNHRLHNAPENPEL